ncbi:MAG TPA: VOC family protein [Steroidobacteraceae bacterium]|nr:VOC family protein [Steroidobacteraceae bacterium]
MSGSTAAVPHGYHAINPYLTVKDLPALVEFLHRTFGGVTTEEITQSDGTLQHVEVRVGDSLLLVGAPQVDAPMPSHPEPRPGTFYVYVADVDETYRRAMQCGANSYEAPTNVFYGDRVAAVTDSNNNVWWIATRRHSYSKRQLQERAEKHWEHGDRSA